MVPKRILCPDRLRRVPKKFSWVDHRLVRDKRICGLSHQASALYLFLVTVSDADGLSYYSDNTINRYLRLDAIATAMARAELCSAGLIAFHRPLYQVLSLDSTETYLSAAPCEQLSERPRRKSEPDSLLQILQQVIGGKK